MQKSQNLSLCKIIHRANIKNMRSTTTKITLFFSVHIICANFQMHQKRSWYPVHAQKLNLNYTTLNYLSFSFDQKINIFKIGLLHILIFKCTEIIVFLEMFKNHFLPDYFCSSFLMPRQVAPLLHLQHLKKMLRLVLEKLMLLYSQPLMIQQHGYGTCCCY